MARLLRLLVQTGDGDPQETNQMEYWTSCYTARRVHALSIIETSGSKH